MSPFGLAAKEPVQLIVMEATGGYESARTHSSRRARQWQSSTRGRCGISLERSENWR